MVLKLKCFRGLHSTVNIYIYIYIKLKDEWCVFVHLLQYSVLRQTSKGVSLIDTWCVCWCLLLTTNFFNWTLFYPPKNYTMSVYNSPYTLQGIFITEHSLLYKCKGYFIVKISFQWCHAIEMIAFAVHWTSFHIHQTVSFSCSPASSLCPINGS